MTYKVDHRKKVIKLEHPRYLIPKWDRKDKINRKNLKKPLRMAIMKCEVNIIISKEERDADERSVAPGAQ